MLNRLFILIFIVVSNYNYAQKQNSYIFFDFKSNIISNNEGIKLFYEKSNCEEEIKSIETNLFLIKNKRKKILIRIGTKSIYIDLKKYKKERFFNITLNLDDNSKGVVYEYKRGDLIKTYNNCDGDRCDILIIEFPQIIILNEQYTTSINKIFAKYIFE